MKKYAIYLRKSRADIEAEKFGEGETLKRHEKILTDLAARQGLYIEKVYREIVSGETIKARPEIQNLISDCYAGLYAGILVVEVSRLSRGNQGDAQIILDCLRFSNQNNGILVITPTKAYDIAHNPDDEEYMEFELFMSRREYKMIKRRMDRGREQAVVEGNYMGSYRPYGYEILNTKVSRTLRPNKDEAPIVKLIYEWAVNENMTAGAIARRLTSMGVPTYRGNREWSHDTVKTILTNPTYIGKVRWNDRMTVKKMIDGELVSSRPRSTHTDKYMEFEGKHAGLVSEEMFKAASSRFTVDRTKSGYTLQNPLAGLLICPNCGKTMRSQFYKSKKRYAAPRYYHVTSDFCKVKSATIDDVLNALIHGLKLYIEDFQVKIDNLSGVNENAVKLQIEALQKEITKAEKVLNMLFDAWENGDITNNEFAQRKTVNNERIENAKKELAKLQASIPEREEYEEKIMYLHDAIDALNDPNLEAAAKNEFLKQIIDKIEFSRENNEEFILEIFLKP